MAAIERAGRDRVNQLEGADHGAGGQEFHAQPAAGQRVHAGHVVIGEFVEDVALRPGGLEAQGRGLRAADARRGQHRGAGGGHGACLEKAAASGPGGG